MERKMAPDVNKSFAAKAGVALLSLGLTFLPAANAGAQNTHAQATPQTVALNQTGKPVTLRSGPGFNIISAMGIRDDLVEAGCPATLTNERSFPGRITVEVENQKFSFKSAGSAGDAALDWCLNRS